MPARRDGTVGRVDVPLTILRIGQEVEDRPVVPEVIGTSQSAGRDVRFKPRDAAGLPAKPLFRPLQGVGGDIQHGQVGISPVEQCVHEQRGPAAGVNDARILPCTGGLDQLK